MDFEKARFNMVEQQVRPWDVLDPDVLDAMMDIKREDFVPAAHRALAFADLELPIGAGQVMLAPKIEARILQAVALRKADKVLEIGTGTGFLTALLASHAAHVVSIECHAELARTARDNLSRANIRNATVIDGDGAAGWPQEGPYDVIVVGGALPVVPAALPAQLKVGGRLFAIVGEAPAMQAQLITRVGETQYQTVGLFETVVPVLEHAVQPNRFTF